jgi:predicted Zn finger-like uncharacterized protein
VKISCPTCSAKYSVADEKIQSRLAKIRCRKCSSTIVIDGMTSPAKVYVGDAGAAISPSGPPQDMEASPGSGRGGPSGSAPGGADPVGPAQDEYAVDIADNDQRNMTIHQIVGAYNEGLITADTYIWKEGMADWQTLGEVREVASALHAAARPAVAAQPAAVRRGNHNSSADLFGRIHTAGGEDDITTSAPEAAPAMTAGTGARNESSVLFSLSALTGSPAAAVAPTGGSSSSSSSKRRNSDDSGLIDLQALTSADTSGGAGGFAAAPSAFGASPLISAPLGGVSGPALGGGAGYGGRSGSRWGLIAAAVVLAVAMIGGAVMFLPRGGGEADQPTSALDRAGASATDRAAAPKEPAPKEPAANAPSEPGEPNTAAGSTRPVVAEELPTAPAEPAATTRPSGATKPATPRAPRPAVAKPASVPTPAPAAAPEAAPKPAAAAPAAEPKKRCECKPSDLLCAMKCSAKKP